jgi:hypothetical protein
LCRGGLWVGHLLHETVENNVATIAVAVWLLLLLLLLMMMMMVMMAVRGHYRNGIRKISSSSISSGSSSSRIERQTAFCCYRASISCSSYRILTRNTLT